jgi:pilus assembly protein FimV
MAFGFGFNKQKVLSTAEKFVQQGKLPSAIAEYEKILKADPKDLTVSNTVGDLHARLGQNDKAIECFKSVGDAYASQGFTVKAIAMYKKLTKLKPTLEGVLRLAELYTQQGLFNDARAQYLQVAEEFLRAGELEQAVRIFQKTLEMDPENVAMRVRLAEVYLRLNKKTEAWQIFASAADSLRARGQLGPAEEILQRMLTLDPGNSHALLLRGRNAFDSGDMAGAIANLEKVADLDTHPDGLHALMQAYLQAGRLEEAGTLAGKLFTVHNDTGAIISYAEALMAAGRFEDLLLVYQQYSDRLLATESASVMECLHAMIGHVRENAPLLETLLQLLQKAGDSTHTTEVYELLAHAYVHSGELEKAREYYLKLTQLEPQNQLHARNYQQVVARLGGGVTSRLITAEEGAVLVEELEATAPFIDQRYPDEAALAIRAALTDAELFVSYNMPAKALGPLLSALPRAPKDLRLNQRLAALHTRAGRFAEAAICCRTLEGVYHDAGYPEEATRYGELAAKYEERNSASAVETEKVALPEFQGEQPVVSAADSNQKAPAAARPASGVTGLFFHSPSGQRGKSKAEAAEFEVQSAPASEQEIDISEEWEGELSAEPPAVSLPEEIAVETATTMPTASAESAAIEETVEEIRFYLTHSMVEQAQMAFAKLERLKPGSAMLSAMQAEIDAASAQAPDAHEAIEEVSVEEIEPAAFEETAALPAASEAPQESAAHFDSVPGDEYLPRRGTPEIEPASRPLAPEYAAASTVSPVGVLGEFVSDLEASLGDSFLPDAPEPQPEPAPQSKPQSVIKKASKGKVASTQSPHFAAPAASAAAAAAPALESPAPSPAFTYQPTEMRPLATQAAPHVPITAAGAGIDLADMFGELKHELEEDTATADEDPETHYNLGVAFREMGLLDEAIGELQKVCQAVDRGHTFPQLMQTYTWLAQCFLDKGVPEAAIRWYEKALKLAGIDEETRTALHYELASAYEAAGNRPEALHHFTEVYGSNIDYRDVGERIKALKS